MNLLNAVGKFEKVPFEEFHRALWDCRLFDTQGIIDYDKFGEKYRYIYDDLKLPTRSTVGSAGYDFYSPFSFSLHKGCSGLIPTGIRVKIEDGWFLACFPRSSLGFKYRLQLDNTVGIMDSSYYYSDNYGHIFVKLHNDNLKTEGMVHIKAGDRFVQGIFLPYGVTYDDDVTEVRNGGMGSTGK